MAGNKLTVRDRFPRFTGRETDKEQIRMLSEYVYMLTEQLEFLLNNLGRDNWNRAELQELIRQIREEV